ncbi:MAG: response regulator transcription factor [Bryobacteraceae bacterium]|nr:response regulator transcription factor [Bryobacteraceae bacterium]
MPHALLVDDDVELMATLAEYLNSQGFTSIVKHTAEQGVRCALDDHPAVVILDVMLPDRSGFDALRQIRAHSRVPVLVLTARADDVDRIVGLELGADDYLRKPFNPRELLARIQAVLRRAGSAPAPSSTPSSIEVGNLCLDLSARAARAGDTTIPLTSAEYELLRMLLTPPGGVVTREDIFRTVLGRSYSASDRSADNHVSALRRKLGSGATGTHRIKSIRNIGYVYAYSKD